MDVIDYQKLGHKIKALRKNANMTQEQLAEMCEISTSYIGHIERGSRKLSLETAVKLADCLNVSLDYLFLDSKKDGAISKAIESTLNQQSKERQQLFLSLLKVLADNIDKI